VFWGCHQPEHVHFTAAGPAGSTGPQLQQTESSERDAELLQQIHAVEAELMELIKKSVGPDMLLSSRRRGAVGAAPTMRDC